jgi:hypothetical protein
MWIPKGALELRLKPGAAAGSRSQPFLMRLVSSVTWL